ncbi:uncharacterized protein zgc:174935 [Silurus meridionalis]|uniref:Uncharacterized protein n=1 Tax=Silurus meridionalis TaxID=175797 RepID=A0A8T0BNA3_SILME|nr:uncharacterized protein zgc:174935 [Silurus meridionalis]KAF7708599.1 hypothetical protein HF521_017656 [Silurus meridionalis]
MRYLAVLVVLMVALNLGLLGVIHSRKNMELQLTKTAYFENVKHRVTSDVLKEYESNISEGTKRLEEIKTDVVDLTAKVKITKEAAEGKEAELKTCTDELNELKNDVGTLQTEKNKTDSEFQKQKASLTEQINSLKSEAEKRSKVCDYITNDSPDGIKLCGVGLVLQEKKANST